MKTRCHFHRLLALAAAAAPGAGRAAQTSGAELGVSLVQVGLGLAVVLALLVAALFVLKRLTAPRGAAAGVLRIVAATALGARERVVLVEIGETWLVLGVAPGRVSALHTLARLAQTAPGAPAPATGGDFAAWLDRITARNRDS
ncbi:MAG: hypothetical protein Fur0039_16420 [Rhodocyclaceae bacterium]